MRTTCRRVTQASIAGHGVARRTLNRAGVAGLLLAAAGAIGPRPVTAQEGFMQRLYLAGGFGAGGFTPTCDTECLGDRLGANSLAGYLGFALSSRLRVEVGAQRTQSTDDGDGTTGGYYASAVSVGLSVYPTSHFYLRGGVVTRMTLEVPNAIEYPFYGKDGPGWSAGAGYDFHIVRALAITPFVNAFGASIDKLDYWDGTTYFQTAGSAIAIHGGLFLTFRPPLDL